MTGFLSAFRDFNRKYKILGMSYEMLFSILLTLLSLILAICFPGSPWKWLCFCAMFMSTAGDLFLTPGSIFGRWIKTDLFLFGGTAFGLAHLLYAAAHIQKATVHGRFPLWSLAAWAVLYSVAVAGLTVSHKRNQNGSRSLYLLILLYSAIICFNACCVFAAALNTSDFASWLAFVGIISFYISDAILLCGVVGPTKIPFYDEWIWIFYPIGQILLILCA